MAHSAEEEDGSVSRVLFSADDSYCLDDAPLGIPDRSEPMNATEAVVPTTPGALAGVATVPTPLVLLAFHVRSGEALDPVPEHVAVDTSWKRSSLEVSNREMSMLRRHAVAVLLHQQPGTPSAMLQYLEELPFASFATVMCGLGLGLTYEDDFELLGTAV